MALLASLKLEGQIHWKPAIAAPQALLRSLKKKKILWLGDLPARCDSHQLPARCDSHPLRAEDQLDSCSCHKHHPSQLPRAQDSRASQTAAFDLNEVKCCCLTCSGKKKCCSVLCWGCGRFAIFVCKKLWFFLFFFVLNAFS